MEWKKLILKISKSEGNLDFLNSIYDSPKKLSDIPLNYKTSCRIFNQLSSLNLVSKDETKVSLTPLGQFISCFLLGKFKSDFPGKNEIAEYVDREELFIGRKETIAQILSNISLCKSTIITGERGIGKTSLLNHLRKRYVPEAIYAKIKPPSEIVRACAKHLGIPTRRRNSERILEDIGRTNYRPAVLLVDEMERATKSAAHILKALSRMNFIIVGAGISYPKAVDFHSEIALKGLTPQQAQILVMHSLRKEMKEIPDDLAELIANATGNPERLEMECTHAILLNRDKKLNTKKEIHENFGEAQFAKKVVLLPSKALLPLGFLLLSLRFMLYGIGNFEAGYLIGTVAYAIYFIRSLKK